MADHMGERAVNGGERSDPVRPAKETRPSGQGWDQTTGCLPDDKRCDSVRRGRGKPVCMSGRR